VDLDNPTRSKKDGISYLEVSLKGAKPVLEMDNTGTGTLTKLRRGETEENLSSQKKFGGKSTYRAAGREPRGHWVTKNRKKKKVTRE